MDNYSMISGSPLKYEDMCTVRQPTLGDIRDIGYDTYQQIISTMLMTKDSILKVLGVDKKQAEEISFYGLVCAIPEIRALLTQALSFFVLEPISWDADGLTINGQVASEFDMDSIRAMALDISNVKNDDVVPRKFASEKARQIWEKLNKGRESLRKAKKEDVNMELANLIGAVSAQPCGYTLLNIWDLTVCQLYDQFARINVCVQLDIYGTRWAAWGKDDFDTSLWFKNISHKGDEMQ